jgi:putative oxidoreductase
MTDVTSGTTGRNGWNIGLWVAQGVLAFFYGYAGFTKLSQTMESLGAMGMSYALDFPELLTRFIGTMEVLGAIGIILPALTRIQPRLTPLAAMAVHITRGEFGVLPMNLVLLALSLFVLWGRSRKAPIASR